MKLIPIGSKVLIGDTINATIQAITINHNNYVQYQCVWWNNNQRQCEWLNTMEVSLADGNAKIPIGFVESVRSNGRVLVRMGHSTHGLP